jgi:hypothetical protein
LFSNQKSQFGKKFRASDWKLLIYFMAIWNTLRIFGIFCDYSVHFVFIWYIFPVWVSCTKKNLATLLSTSVIFSSPESSPVYLQKIKFQFVSVVGLRWTVLESVSESELWKVLNTIWWRSEVDIDLRTCLAILCTQNCRSRVKKRRNVPV